MSLNHRQKDVAGLLAEWREATDKASIAFCQRLANAFVANQKRIQADLEPILRTAMADAWDEGYHRGTRDAEMDIEPADNPYRESDQ